MFTIEALDARDVPDDVAAVLHDEFTLGAGGQMAAVFRTCRNPNRTGWTGRCFIARDSSQGIVGWGLRWKAFSGSTRWSLFVFVDKSRRREGIGTLIASEAVKRLSRPVKGFVWDATSEAFYGAGPHPRVVPQETRSRAA